MPMQDNYTRSNSQFICKCSL